MPLNGIDIASYQSSLVPSKMETTDFIIVKATGGTGYTNPCFKEHAAQTLAACKLLGFYHYAREVGCAGSAVAEADYFVSRIKPYVTKATLWLDWEAGAIALGPKWAKAFCDRVLAKTGVKPGIYMSKGVCNQFDWSALSKAGYPLWVAQYPDYSQTGYRKESQIWTDGNPFGAWGRPVMFQYTSTGRIAGYGGNLDLDCFYGTKADWKKLASKAGIVTQAAAAAKPKASDVEAISRANVAAQIMEHLCTCPEHGYSQPGRYGTSGYCKVKTDAGTIEVRKGDRDCSSAVCEAWELALKGTPYEGKIVKTGWTGNMRSMFVGSGLFSWRPMSFIAQRGDIYLDEEAHTAMCTSPNPDMLAEFSISETGGIDGKPGDQTGRESSIHDYYEAWDGILHYNGKADSEPKPQAGGTEYTVIAKRADVHEKRVLSSKTVGTLKKGQTVRLATLMENRRGNVWARIVSGNFKRRYIPVTLDGETIAVKSGAKTLDEIALEVVEGKWGCGQARFDALTKKGYDAAEVQRRVNKILE